MMSRVPCGSTDASSAGCGNGLRHAAMSHTLLLAGVFAVTALSGVSRAAEPTAAGQTGRATSNGVYVALHMQHYTGMCGDSYAAVGARGRSSICLYDAQPVSAVTKPGAPRGAWAIAVSQGAP